VRFGRRSHFEASARHSTDRLCHATPDLVIYAAAVIVNSVIDLVGGIGQHWLSNLPPDRRIRTARGGQNAIPPDNANGAGGRITYRPPSAPTSLLQPTFEAQPTP